MLLYRPSGRARPVLLYRPGGRVRPVLLCDNAISGNCGRVRLLLNRLGITYERRELSVCERSGRGDRRLTAQAPGP